MIDFYLVRGQIPVGLSNQIENAVKDLHQYSGKSDLNGFYQQTIESIASATFLNQSGDFWVATENSQLVAYVLARFVKDIDNRLCYWISQAWIDKKYRRSDRTKLCWQVIRKRAKECFCSHIIVVSTRGVKAYCRFLGQGWHLYANLLKEDL